MILSEANIHRCESKIYEALVKSKRARVLGLSPLQAAEMSGYSVRWANEGYKDNLVGESLRREVRRQFTYRYGSIWTILLFTLIWELIKKYLFETK